MELESDDILDTSKLKFSGDFDQQVSEVVEHIHLKKGEVEKLNGLIMDLYNVLSPIWGDVQVLGFGSIVTGLGIRTSDVDCYVKLPRGPGAPDKSLVLRAKNVLMQHQRVFQNAFAIVHAKVPIVQFYHAPTRVHCDLSFNSPAGLANSKLIAYLLNSNRKALHLALLVKYWSKVHNLTGTNLMSSYSMTLLVIFFLQQINMLHSIAELQANVEESYIDEWNSAFGALPCNNDRSLLYELLGEFFKYYRAFEFDKYIICPYLGKPISRELFAKVESVPSNFFQYKINVGSKDFEPLRLDSPMCVQDPFQHNRNCAVAVYAKLVHKISAQIQHAASIYENYSENDFLKKILQRSMPDSAPAKTKKRRRPPINGVKKQYKRNENFKHLKQNFRKNYSRGNQGNFRH